MTVSTVMVIAVLPIAQLDPLAQVGSLTEGLRSPARVAIGNG